MFSKSFIAGAGDFDVDGRFRGATCLERAKDVRLMYFAEQGFPPDLLRKQRLAPLILKDRLDYQRDIDLLDEYKISLALAGLSTDGSRYMLRCELTRSDGKVAARITSTGGWLDANLQKLTTPPQQLITALQELPMTADYQVLLTTIK